MDVHALGENRLVMDVWEKQISHGRALGKQIRLHCHGGKRALGKQISHGRALGETD